MDIPGDLVRYSQGQIECMAKELSRSRPDVPNLAPINVERLIENSPDVDLQIRESLKTRHRVEGCVCKERHSKNLTVFVDMGVFRGPWANYNTVLGEEFAHIKLHGALFLKVQAIEDFLQLQRHEQWHRIERDAKAFSRAIRLPFELIEQEVTSAYQRFVSDHGFGDPIKIEHLVRHHLSQVFRATPDDVRSRMLDYPLHLSDRISVSVLSKRDQIAPVDYIATVKRSSKQPLLFRDQSNW